jgi:hypothetical protein
VKSAPLSQTHPELALEADGWDPNKVTAGMRKKMQWRCALGHRFESTISLRAGKSTGCPSCKNRRVETGFNDLNTKFPEIANEANGWNPNEVLFGSHSKKSWRCLTGHVYVATVESRTGKRKTGCPFCANQKVLAGYNDLATTHPKVAAEADGWDPAEVITGSNKKKNWKCVLGHSYVATVIARIGSEDGKRKGTSCPVCVNQKIIVGINDLATTHPDLVSEVDGWDPTKVVSGTSRKANWICPKGHKYKTLISLRALRGTGCPVCSNSQILTGYNDLATTHPSIAAEADGWDPTTVSAGSSKKYSWNCIRGHKYKSPPDARTGKRKRGCPFCANQKVLAGFNDLATTHPEIAKEADGWDPTEVIAGSKVLKPWKCSKGHLAVQPILHRSRAEVSCPICGNRAVLSGFNDIATTHPEVAKEADGWDPTTLLASSEAKQKWKCSKGHSYFAVVYSRTLAGNGCSVCANRTVQAGFNDLATTHPEIAKEADGWDPSTVSYGSETKNWWLCPVGHRYKTSPNKRTMGRGCPTCAESGFDPNKEAFLYFLEHPIWEMYQIGITNVPEIRLRKHERSGWELIEIRGPMDGHLTQNWETSILRMLRKKGADLSNKKIAGKFDGYSEAWSKSTFAATSIQQLMRATEVFEEGR